MLGLALSIYNKPKRKGKDPVLTVSMHTHHLKDRGSYIVGTKLGQGELQRSQELRHEQGPWERALNSG